MKDNIDIIFILIVIVFFECCSSVDNKVDYFNQTPPGNIPEILAPSILNTDSIEINAVFNSTYTELFFTRIISKRFVIHHSNKVNGKWTDPRPIEMFEDSISESVAIDPSVNKSGDRLYFLGVSPEDRERGSKPDIYCSMKINDEWQLATRVNEPVSTVEYAESYPVVVGDGSLYFTSDRPGGLGQRDIYRAQYLGDGRFDTPINIGSEVNSDRNERSTFVSSDESYLITGNTLEGASGFVVYKKEDGYWGRPEILDIGVQLEKEWIYFCPYMTPDDKYFFYSRRRSDPPLGSWNTVVEGEVYWVQMNDSVTLE